MTHPQFDVLWTGATLATMAGEAPYGLVRDGAVGVRGDEIAWVGPAADLPVAARAAEVRECGGALVTPGLIDCHTHLVYAGDRAREFEQRLNGVSYEQIARAGGGIVSTVRATRAASDAALRAQSAPRLARLLAEGVTTVEIKSGYGLDTSSELKMLRVARGLADLGVTVRTTFLGAHALPPEFAGRADDYIDRVCDEMLPAVAEAGLADAVDAFCETIGFTPAQVARVFDAAARHDLPVKLHAEQLSNQHGARLTAQHRGLSADHLEYLDEEGAAAMAASGTVAVLLPGAFYCLRETRVPPVDVLRRHGVPMALATDCNPGTSPVTSLLLMLSMGCTLFGLTPAEAFAGVTRHAAAALGLAARCGTIEAGKRADLVLWDASEPAELAYRVGDNPCRAVLFGGKRR